MTNDEGRIIRLELMVRELQKAARDASTRMASAEQVARQPMAMMWDPGGGGGGPGVFVAHGLTIAAGTAPPGGAPASDTGDVYKVVGGAYAAAGTGVTIYNALQDATDSSKTQLLAPNGDGTYTVIAESCT